MSTVSYLELAEDMANVRFDRSFRDHELARDLLICATSRNLNQNVELAVGESSGFGPVPAVFFGKLAEPVHQLPRNLRV